MDEMCNYLCRWSVVSQQHLIAVMASALRCWSVVIPVLAAVRSHARINVMK